MKKVIALVILAVISATSVSAMACPRGEHPYGGTGSHHKGGWCGF